LNIYSIATPILRRFRRRRMSKFVEMFNVTENTRVLDVGGNTFNWEFVDVRPQLTFINLEPAFFGGGLRPSDRIVVGDGCTLPFEDQSFDIVFCNSVIEHVTTKSRQYELAREIDRVGKRYFVQTPNYWFPIEPHYMGVGIQFMPKRVRTHACRWLSLWGLMERPTAAKVRELVDEIRLLSKREMQPMFPGAQIVSERAAGLTKSLIAVRK
jgi:SAM-dependent methyltransferase